MKKKAILVASFGTSYDDARQQNIAPLEERIRKAYPEFLVVRAFTSNFIIKALAKRGIEIPTVQQALDQLAQDGVEEVYIQPTHIIPGEEFEKVTGAASQAQGKFRRLRVGQPLLATTQDMMAMVHWSGKNFSLEPKECLVWMGHGTNHFANTAYAAMDYMYKEQGYPQIFMGTVEAYPNGIDTVLEQIKKQGYTKAVLAPFMLVAGDHAKNDLAGEEEDSWKNHFARAGIPVRVVMKGLGEYPQVQDIYLDHLASIMEE